MLGPNIYGSLGQKTTNAYSLLLNTNATALGAFSGDQSQVIVISSQTHVVNGFNTITFSASKSNSMYSGYHNYPVSLCLNYVIKI